MPACNPPPSPTTHILMQCANNTSATCVCHYYEAQSPGTISRCGFWDRHTAINAYSGHLPGRFCPTERGPRLAPRKKAFLVVIVGYRGGGEKPDADFMHISDFFQYLFISVSQVIGQQESLQRSYPVVREQTPLLSKAAYVAGASKGASHVDSHLEAQYLDAGTGFL